MEKLLPGLLNLKQLRRWKYIPPGAYDSQAHVPTQSQQKATGSGWNFMKIECSCRHVAMKTRVKGYSIYCQHCVVSMWKRWLQVELLCSTHGNLLPDKFMLWVWQLRDKAGCQWQMVECTVVRFGSGKHWARTTKVDHSYYSRDSPDSLQFECCHTIVVANCSSWRNSCIVSMCGHLHVGIEICFIRYLVTCIWAFYLWHLLHQVLTAP